MSVLVELITILFTSVGVLVVFYKLGTWCEALLQRRAKSRQTLEDINTKLERLERVIENQYETKQYLKDIIVLLEDILKHVEKK